MIEGGAIQWRDTDSGPLLWVPADRLEASWLRELRRGSTSGLARSERPSGELLEAWVEAGAPFATELSSMARLMRDNVPLHKGSWEAAAEMKEGFSTLICHLPRVARVVGVYVPSAEETPRRILVSSDLQISAAKLVATAG